MMSIMMRPFEEDGTKVRIAPRDVQYQNIAFGLITNLGPIEQHPQYCRLLTFSLYARWCRLTYSNNVQVAPDGALAGVGVKQCSDPSSQQRYR